MSDDINFITISNNKKVIIDSDDFSKVSQHKWYNQNGVNTSYAYRQLRLGGNKRKNIPMHSFILNTTKQVDHINGNGLDNRKENLRTVTTQENCMNIPPKHKNKTSIYKGVFKTKSGKYEVQFKKDRKSNSLGRLKDEELAAKCYDAVVKYYYNDIPYLNFPNLNDITPCSIQEMKSKINKYNVKTINKI